MIIPRKFEGLPGIVCCTGPSLSKAMATIRMLDVPLFGMNNVYHDLPVHVHVASDPLWHATYAPELKGALPDADLWTWDAKTARLYDLKRYNGIWADGLSTDPRFLHFGHSSSYQALGLAYLYGCSPIFMVGFDMHYNDKKRHYFDNLSDLSGEYPPNLRKFSKFDGLIRQFRTVAEQGLDVPIYNATEGSAFPWFPQIKPTDITKYL